jgi:F-type H+-transporting ATPase subunit delta
MRHLQIAKRYAKALFTLAQEKGLADRVIAELRELSNSFQKDAAISGFFSSPVTQPKSKEQALKSALETAKILPDLRDFILLLARRNRLVYFSAIVQAFEEQSDAAHGVTRGVVESAIALGPEDRRHIESIVKKVTKKEVILSYKTNPKIIGGLVASVGSYTFDDSIQSHLRRMNEDLKRRTI